MSNRDFLDRMPQLRLASVDTSDVAQGRGQVQWLLKRNCSITPGQLGALYASLCAVSLGIAALLWAQGARLVLPFTLVELVAVAVAFLVYARHAGDAEKIVIDDQLLVVELESGGRTEKAEFNRAWVRVVPRSGDGSLIEVSGQGCSVRVGRHLRPELRRELAREIRLVLGCV